MAIVDYFLNLDGIPSECPDSKHGKDIQIERFSFGLKSPRDIATGQASGKRQYAPVTFHARVNKASPKIMIACANNQPIKKAVLTIRRPGKTAEEYFIMTLTDATVSKYSCSGGADLAGMAHGLGKFGEGASQGHSAAEGFMVVPLDEWEMTFRKIEVTYKPFDAHTGVPGGPVTVADDWSTNVQ